MSVYSDKAGTDEADFLVTKAEAPADKNDYQIILTTPYSGLHRVEVRDGGGRTKVLPTSDKTAWTVDASVNGSFQTHHLIGAYFYVPAGIKKLSIRANPTKWTKFYDGDMNEVFKFQEGDKPGYFTIDVPKGQDGKIWLMDSALWPIHFLNVPGTLASTPEQLLIPLETVQD